MNFSVIYKPDQRSFINANIALLRSRLAFRIVAVVVLIMTIASIVSFFVFTKSNHTKNISPIFLLVYVAIVLAVMYIRLKKRYTQYPVLSQEKKYTFTDKSIYIKGATFEVNTGWENVTKIYTTKNFLFLFLNRRDALYIAKDKFTPSQLQAISAKALTNRTVN